MILLGKVDLFTLRDVTSRSDKLDLFLASFLALFLEVVLIRWVPSYERMLAYFTNCVLIAAFLGLGVGAMLARQQRDLIRYQPLLIFVLVAVAILFNTYVKTTAVGEVFYSEFGRTTRLSFSVETSLIIFFALVGAQFVPLGQRIGKDLMRCASPISGYIVNLLGSLLGVVVFAGVSFLQLSPAWWFAFAMTLLLWFMRTERKVLALNAVVGGLTVAAVWAAGAGFIWSPYHKIVVSPLVMSRETGLVEGDLRGADTNEMVDLPPAFGFHVTVDDDFLQVALNLSPSVVAANGFLRDYQHLYDLPYVIHPDVSYQDVLIVGAGTGNDTAAALRGGAERIDAVEIDPALVRLGRNGHPENPYGDPRVHVWVDDARSYFNKTPRRYDLVVFGLLDSHRLFSQMSSVRLDSFVFTVESFREVKRLLKPRGLVVVQHALGPEFIGARMSRMLTEAFERPPVLVSHKDRWSRWLTFITGPGAELYLPSLAMPDVPAAVNATDDWPFFYLVGRRLPRDYAIALGLMLVIAVLAVLGGSHGKLRTVNLHFFFLGSAFLLLETLSVTRFALLFGSTWVVNSIVFTAILVVVLGANLWMTRLATVNVHTLYALLGACVLLNYWFPVQALLSHGLALRLAVAMMLMGAPIFFAALVFADSFKRTSVPELAFASNLLGAVVGGLAEYSTMVIGFRSQLLIALMLYGLSYGALLLGNRKHAVAAA